MPYQDVFTSCYVIFFLESLYKFSLVTDFFCFLSDSKSFPRIRPALQSIRQLPNISDHPASNM